MTRNPDDGTRDTASTGSHSDAKRLEHQSSRIKGVKYDVGWTQLAYGGVHAGGGPKDVLLPESLSTAMDQAWMDSKRGTVDEKEQGGNVVRTYGGDYSLRRGTASSSRYFDPDYNDVGRTETYVGIAHTHPYKDYDSVTFSGGDIANMVADEQPMKMLRSGDGTYIIARTPEFAALVKRAGDADRSEDLKREIEAYWETVFNATKGDFPTQNEMATRATCQRYWLVYYEGDRSHLHRV
jgi:hypothetical protein